MTLAAVPTVVIAFLFLGVLTVVNLRTYRLPNPINIVGTIVTLTSAGVTSIVTGDMLWILQAAYGGAAIFAVYFALCVGFPAWMTYGTVKSATILGIGAGVLGFPGWVVALAVPLVIVAMVAAYIYACWDRTFEVPSGPVLLIGLTVTTVASVLGLI